LWLNCRERLLLSPGVPLDTRIRTFAVVSYSEVAQDFALRAGDFGWEGLGGAVERDRRVAQWSEFFDDFGDGESGAGPDAVGDGQGGEHNAWVCFDGLALTVKSRPGRGSSSSPPIPHSA
jgi:hypothetical protein